jgi:hypothetical protein
LEALGAAVGGVAIEQQRQPLSVREAVDLLLRLEDIERRGSRKNVVPAYPVPRRRVSHLRTLRARARGARESEPSFGRRRRRFLFAELFVTAQVGWIAHERRRDFAKFEGTLVTASMIFQPCFLAVEKKERMTAKPIAPSKDRKPPEIFWRSFIMRPSRAA